MITRRRFLQATGLATVGVAGVVALRFKFAKPEQAVASVVRRRLDYLKLDPAGVEAFAKDLVDRNLTAPTKLRAMAALGLSDVPLERLGIHSASLRHSEERIVTHYLLSSDFFFYNADESRVVNYRGFFDAARGACLNPFPRSVQGEDAETG